MHRWGNYEKKNNNTDDAHFRGLNGKNVVVQQVMDMVKKTANNPIQFLRFITTNAMINNQMELAEEIQSFVTSAEQEVLTSYTEALNSNDPEAIRKFLLENML